MEVLLKELDQRQVAFRQRWSGGIRRWHGAVPGPRLPYVVAVVDELAELSAAESMDREEKARRQAALASIARMCRPGRALCLQVIASTQRPDAAAVPGQIGANIPATAACRVRSAASRQIRLGEDSAAAAEAMLAPVAGAATACTERVTPCLLSHSVENTGTPV
jgi:DNA segregation ATPase FtsK/SpoIIIE-like protein